MIQVNQLSGNQASPVQNLKGASQAGNTAQAPPDKPDSSAISSPADELAALQKQLRDLEDMKKMLDAQTAKKSEPSKEEKTAKPSLDDELAALQKEKEQLSQMKAEKNRPLSPDEELAALRKELEELKKLAELKKLREEVNALKGELGVGSKKEEKKPQKSNVLDYLTSFLNVAGETAKNNPELVNSLLNSKNPLAQEAMKYVLMNNGTMQQQPGQGQAASQQQAVSQQK